MRIKEAFTSLLLIIIIIILIGTIGIIGYAMYTKIMGDDPLQLTFKEESGFPTIEKKESNSNTSNENNMDLSGVNGNEDISTEKYEKFKSLYNQLDSYSKIIYDKLYKNKENLKTGTYTLEFGDTFSPILSQEGGSEELQKIYQSAIETFIYENPEVFYIKTSNMYLNIEKITKITGIKYNVFINNGSELNYLADGFNSKEDIERAEVEIENVKIQILALVMGKSDYEKMRIVHDYLIDTIEYDTTLSGEHIYNIYGALVEKKCVCEGYAKAYQYMLNELELDNVIVIGTGTNSDNETENHAWNYVKFRNNWYAVDVTWDDPIIIGGGKLSLKSKYKYFLKGRTTFSKNHIPSGQFTDGGQIFEYPTLSVNDYE